MSARGLHGRGVVGRGTPGAAHYSFFVSALLRARLRVGEKKLSFESTWLELQCVRLRRKL
jgi:hypothetical protein